ncbi:MAG: hypothetical protein KGL39_52525 [Patescibacteria group bacterium]|nr:hypothetical protein [Patescibacteria group bacterium]
MKTMILGANGLCGTSLVPLMRRLHPDTELILIDPDEEAKPPVIRAEPKTEEMVVFLKSFGMGKGDILIDLTTELTKLDVMTTADSLGISVINCTACELDRGALSLIDLLDPELLLARHEWECAHIVGAGMNPGNVNAMLGMMAQKYGKPLEVTEWELDSTIPFKWDGEGFATWSPQEFASEFCDESAWTVDGRSIHFLGGPPINNLITMQDGIGAICQHEEIIKWAWLYGCKAKYIYGYSTKAMNAIIKNITNGLELPLCRKLENRIPSGGDMIGVRAVFESGERNCIISAENQSDAVPIGSNATSYLVACGVVAAFAMLTQERTPGIHWPDEYGSRWVGFIKENELAHIQVDADADYDLQTTPKPIEVPAIEEKE